jgi:hypothetical protein
VRKLDVQKERVARLCPLKRRMDKLRGTSRLDEAEHVEVVEVVKFVEVVEVVEVVKFVKSSRVKGLGVW